MGRKWNDENFTIEMLAKAYSLALMDARIADNQATMEQLKNTYTSYIDGDFLGYMQICKLRKMINLEDVRVRKIQQVYYDLQEVQRTRKKRREISKPYNVGGFHWTSETTNASFKKEERIYPLGNDTDSILLKLYDLERAHKDSYESAMYAAKLAQESLNTALSCKADLLVEVLAKGTRQSKINKLNRLGK